MTESPKPPTGTWNHETLFGFLAAVASGEFGDIHGFLLVRHNTLVVEGYSAEGGSKHGDFVSSVFRDRVHHLASTTKPIGSALVGIAIENGFIGNVGESSCRVSIGPVIVSN